MTRPDKNAAEKRLDVLRRRFIASGRYGNASSYNADALMRVFQTARNLLRPRGWSAYPIGVISRHPREVELTALANAWLEEVRCGMPTARDHKRVTVVRLSYTEPADVQWTFLVAAMRIAGEDIDLCAIAAGPFEHLMRYHGAQYIDAIEHFCRVDERFARMTTAAYRRGMSDAVWRRLLAIQARVTDPL